MDGATGFWVFWLMAGLALYFALVWTLLRFGATAEKEDAHGARREERVAGDVARGRPSNEREEGGRPR